MNKNGLMMKINLKKLITAVILAVSSFSAIGKEFCSLHPKDQSLNSRQWVQTFEQNIENKMSEIYQNTYPELIALLKKLETVVEDLKTFEAYIFESHTNRVRRHHKNRSIKRVQENLRKTKILDLIEKDISNPEELEKELKEHSFIRPFSFEEYRRQAERIFEFKNTIEELNEKIRPMKAVHLLYPPEFDYSIRPSGIEYGNLKMEGFLSPPRNNLFRLPFLNIGFETNQNTVIYTCIHFDSFAPEKNFFYVYFLNATKLHSYNWRSLIFSPGEMVRFLVFARKPPEARITPLPFVFNPLASSLSALNTVNERLPELSASSRLSETVGQFNFLDWTANLNPAVKVVLDQFRFGVKGILIQPHRLKISYSASVFYGLAVIDIAEQSHRADFSSFMNVFTWDKDTLNESK